MNYYCDTRIRFDTRTDGIIKLFIDVHAFDKSVKPVCTHVENDFIVVKKKRDLKSLTCTLSHKKTEFNNGLVYAQYSRRRRWW